MLKRVRENSEFLQKLINAPSPSGYEKEATDVFIKEVQSYINEIPETDNFGNAYFKAGRGSTKVLLSGHIDEVSAMVTSISDDGMISFGQAGGIDVKDLTASKVILLADDFTQIPGAVIKLPIHLETPEEKRDKPYKFHELRIDVGAESKAQVENAGIHPGTPVLYERTSDLHFGINRLTGVGLDDKIGVFVASEIFREINYEKQLDQSWKNKYTVYCLAATQEEVGCRSVCVAARRINPDISIDFDVTFATDGDLGISKSKYCDIRLGNGAVLSYGGDKSPRLNHILKECAGTRCQEAAGGRAGGTDTSNIQIFSFNCETTLVSIPNRSMHTRVEVCDWRDVENAVRMVSRAILLKQL